MKIEVPPGRYIIAVSGGVDSMVLLDLLSQKPEIELIIAHFNHGIRSDSGKDESLVKLTARQYGLPVKVGYGRLGKDASEEKARQARYEFLNKAASEYNARQIITAHHKDDLIETALINLMRGTGRKGFSSMIDNPNVLRPLLKFSKDEILQYARDRNISWREDPTNKNTKYLRNFVRLEIMPQLSVEQKRLLSEQIFQLSEANRDVDNLLAVISKDLNKQGVINRLGFINLPTEISYELMAYWLRYSGITGFDKKSVERLAVALKTAKAGTKHNITKDAWLNINRNTAQFDIRK